MESSERGIQLTRRRVLAAAAAAGCAAVATAPIGASPAGAASAGVDFGGVSPDAWSSSVGDTFRVQLGPSSSTTVRLDDVTVTGAGPTFTSAVFSGRTAFAQGTYRVSSARLGAGDLFLVPIGRPQRVQRYEAVMSRM